MIAEFTWWEELIDVKEQTRYIRKKRVLHHIDIWLTTTQPNVQLCKPLLEWINTMTCSCHRTRWRSRHRTSLWWCSMNPMPWCQRESRGSEGALTKVVCSRDVEPTDVHNCHRGALSLVLLNCTPHLIQSPAQGEVKTAQGFWIYDEATDGDTTVL